MSHTFVFQQLQTHHDGGNRCFQFMRDSRDKRGFCRIQFLKLCDVFQQHHIAPLLHCHPIFSRHRDVHVLHLKITFLIVGIDFQRLLLHLSTLFYQPSYQTAQQVVAHGYFLSRLPDDVFPLQVQHIQCLMIDKKDIHFIVQSDNRFINGVDDSFHVAFGSHQVGQGTVMILVQSSGHPVKVLRNFHQFFASFQIQSHIVIMVGYFQNAIGQLFDWRVNRCRQLDEHTDTYQDANASDYRNPYQGPVQSRTGSRAIRFRSRQNLQISHRECYQQHNHRYQHAYRKRDFCFNIHTIHFH